MSGLTEIAKGKTILYDLLVQPNEAGENVFVFKGKEYERIKAKDLKEGDTVLVLRKNGDQPEPAEKIEGNPDPCKSCGQIMYWREHPTTGKSHPYNEDGTSHFSTCPKADDWRGKRRGGE